MAVDKVVEGRYQVIRRELLHKPLVSAGYAPQGRFKWIKESEDICRRVDMQRNKYRRPGAVTFTINTYVSLRGTWCFPGPEGGSPDGDLGVPGPLRLGDFLGLRDDPWWTVEADRLYRGQPGMTSGRSTNGTDIRQAIEELVIPYQEQFQTLTDVLDFPLPAATEYERVDGQRVRNAIMSVLAWRDAGRPEAPISVTAIVKPEPGWVFDFEEIVAGDYLDDIIYFVRTDGAQLEVTGPRTILVKGDRVDLVKLQQRCSYFLSLRRIAASHGWSDPGWPEDDPQSIVRGSALRLLMGGALPLSRPAE